jgi:ubiquinone/menaquinone biosynthesis C-methylase UbiE
LKELQVSGWKDKRKVMQRYDLTSEMYEERYAEEQRAKYEEALKHLSVNDCAVLDVGCGTGLFFSHVTTKAKLVVGVDISRKLLRKAKEQAAVFGNVFVVQADADHLPFKSAFFDFVFSFTVLQNMPKPSETLNEFKKAIKPHGKVVVTGLKKAIPLEKFMDILEGSGLRTVFFVDNEELKCYVAVLDVQRLPDEKRAIV